MTFTKSEKKWALIGYGAFMLIFFFIGIPKAKFGTYVLGFIVTTAVYAVGVWFVKKFFIDPAK